MESSRGYCNNCHNQLHVTNIRCCKCQPTVGSSSSSSALQLQNHQGCSSSYSTSSSMKTLLRCGNMDKDHRFSTEKSSPWLFSTNPLKYSTFPAARQHRKAVLCGVRYRDSKYELNGVINDVRNIWNLLTHQFSFPKHAICVLTDDDDYLNLSPTKKNIQQALKWLVQDCMSGDSLVFYFSGHGLRQPDFQNDETDGYDETLCPVDFTSAGMILDNEINDYIVKPQKTGVKLHAIVDACHSGTILDLEHVYKRKKKLWIDNKPPSGAYKGTNGGLAVSLSACADNKLAVDTTAFNKDAANGALTYMLTEIMKEKNGEVTYEELLNGMHKMIESVNNNNSSFIKRLFRNEIIQEPQLSASQVINLNWYLGF